MRTASKKSQVTPAPVTSTPSLKKEKIMRTTKKSQVTTAATPAPAPASTAPASTDMSAILAALAAAGIQIPALAAAPAAPAAAPVAPVTDEGPSPRRRNAAPAEYEASEWLGCKDFEQCLYAAPKSDDAARYFAEAQALCSAILEDLSKMKGKPVILDDVIALADYADESAGKGLVDRVIALCDTWKVTPQALRVILQLVCPVLCGCNAEGDKLARRLFGMSRANALFGSACNSLMYYKANDKNTALPFIRTCRNYSRLGLDLVPSDCVESCDWLENQEDYNELLTLCHYWLNQCTPVDPAPTAPTAPRKGRKVAPVAPAPAATPDFSDMSKEDLIRVLTGLITK